ncbi:MULTISPECIES: adenylate/guanylate cyclase domain-containing protein [Agrobacterium]|uniref:adenylate/guanylate cyclase domain-containing protein n=1 Tax=Agrobacterium TaxID=357 RepID=UPI000698F1C1|nr:adenylate/guanylate cyclase domain-containing protein [Agrobacterium fabrum]CUX59025.1 Family 3 adenylate cyclase [Agrobacterium fabrum str. J-07]
MLDWFKLRFSAALLSGSSSDKHSRLYDAEIAGLVVAFRVRLCAVAVIAIWLLVSTVWPRNLYYLTVSLVFLALSYIPYATRRHRAAWPIKIACTILDVALITSAILLPPLGDFAPDWPVQTRTRGPEYLYVLLLLAESALTYSPILVLWTGGVIVAIWSAGISSIYNRPDTVRSGDADGISGMQALERFLTPNFVGLTQMWVQVVTTVLFTLCLAIAVLRSRNTLIAQINDNAVRESLALYVSPDVAHAMRDDVSDFGAPSKRKVAVMFVDIVGFTRMAENQSPERALALLSSFQERGCSVIFNCGGTLDKFLGDGIMATFGGVEQQPDAAGRALACAFDLLNIYSVWNAKRATRGAELVRVSIGLHFGEVIVGNVGTSERREFTVIGDVVNVASRLERATRELRGSLLVSDACLQAAGSIPPGCSFTSATTIDLEGRDGSIYAHIA